MSQVSSLRIAAARHAKDMAGKAVGISGWIRTIRKQGKITFFEVNDGSCLRNMQVVADFDVHKQQNRLALGASVRIEGTLVKGPKSHGEMELQIADHKCFQVLGSCDPAAYPLQKKYHSVEFLRDMLHLRPRSNLSGAMLRVRSQLSHAIREFLHEQKFLEINTPVLTSNDCEGAGEMFEIFQKNKDNGNQYDFFNNPTYLTVSGQLHAEIFASSMSKVYTFGPTFRAENSNTSRHLAEFWMLEPEIAFADISDAMALAEGCLKSSVKHVLSNCDEDLDFFNKRVDQNVLVRLAKTLEEPFQSISYSDAIDILRKDSEKNDKANFEYSDIHWGMNLQSEHEKYLSEVVFDGRPTFIHHYPAEIKPFYMKQSMENDGKTVEAFDLVVPKIGELVGGSAREDNYEKLYEAMVSHNIIDTDNEMNSNELEWYLDLRKYGSVPHAGFGMGFERLLQFVTGISNIRDAIPIPRSKGTCMM